MTRNENEIMDMITKVSISKPMFLKHIAKQLQPYINDNEEIVFFEICNYKNEPGELIITDSKILFRNSATFFVKFEEFQFNNITSLNITNGAVMADLAFANAGASVKFTSLAKKNVNEIANYINSKIQNSNISKQNNTNDNNAINKIKQLKELLDSGILSQEEFDKKKAELLAQI